MSSRMFYGISTTENLLIHGADVSNTFAEAPPPQQGFYIYPDGAFNEWWVHHLNRLPLQPLSILPSLLAWERIGKGVARVLT